MKSHSCHFPLTKRLLVRALIACAAVAAAHTCATAQQQQFSVGSVGNWTSYTPGSDTLSSALHETGSSGATIRLTDNLTDSGAWNSWVPMTSGYARLQTTQPLSAGSLLTFDLTGHTLSGTHFAFVTAQGNFLFKSGTIGSTAHDLAFGNSGTRADVVFDNTAIFANQVIIGLDSSGIVALTGHSTLATATLALGGTTAASSGTLTLADSSAATLIELVFEGGAAAINLGTNATLNVSASTGITKSGTLAIDLKDGSAAVFKDDLTLSGGGKTIALDDSTLNVTSTFSLRDGAQLSAANGASITAGDIHVSGLRNSGSDASLTGSGSLSWENTLHITDGGVADLSDFSNNGGPAGSIKLTSTQSLIVDRDSSITNNETFANDYHQTTLSLSGDIDTSGLVAIRDNAKVEGVRDILVHEGGALELSGSLHFDTASGEYVRSALEISGSLVIDSIESNTIANGWKLSSTHATTIGGATDGRLDVTGHKEDINTILETADLVIGGGADGTLNIRDTANVNVAAGSRIIIGEQAGASGTLTISGQGGQRGTELNSRLQNMDIDAKTKANATGNAEVGLVIGKEGSATVTTGTGGEIISRNAVLAQEAGSTATVTINDAAATDDLFGFYSPPHAAWSISGGVEGGATAALGKIKLSKGNSSLTVESGLIFITNGGVLSMGSQNYDSGYGVARFTGGGSELRLATGAFRNEGAPGVGDILFDTGAKLSGRGSVYAGNKIEFNNAVIAPGSSLLYDNDYFTDNLDLHPGSGTVVSITGATVFKTALQSDNTSSHLIVHGGVDIGADMIVDIYRILNGSYLLISATNSGTIGGDYTAHVWDWNNNSNVATATFFTIGGKYITDGITYNERITGSLSTDFNDDKTELWLNVDATAGRNLATHWTGGSSGTWNMFATNWEPTETDGTGQFLDGDIVIFKGDDNTSTNIKIDTLASTSGARNVIVAEIQVLGDGNLAFSGHDIIAYDSELYSSATSGYYDSGTHVPTGRLIKVGTGTLTLENANEFYGGAHLGDKDTTGGVVVLKNTGGLGHYDLGEHAQGNTKGMVFTHVSSTIDATPLGAETIQNRFAIDDGATLTLHHKNLITTSTVSRSTASKGGRGGAFYIEGELFADPGLNIGDPYGAGASNVGTDGGGVYLTGTGFLNAPGATIANNLAIDTYGGGGNGGGIYAVGTTSLTGSLTLQGNASYGSGGGLYLATGSLTVGGSTSFLDNAAIKSGGGAYVADGATLILDTANGDISFKGNLSGARISRDTYTAAHESGAGSSNAIHVADGALLDIKGTGTVFFDDPVSTDATGIINIGDNATVVLKGNSAVLGSSTVNAGATLILAGGTTLYLDHTIVDDATLGVSILYTTGSSPTTGTTANMPGSYIPTADTFVLAAGGTLAGQGRIGALNGITLNGVLNLSNDHVLDLFAGTTLPDDAKDLGTLHLYGSATFGATANWLLNLTMATGSDSRATTITGTDYRFTDLVAVDGAATFSGSTRTDALRLDLDAMVHGKYVILSATSGITGFNTAKNKTGATIYWPGLPGINLASTALTTASDSRLGRASAVAYAEGKNLILNVAARNRHVSGTATSGTWQDNGLWEFKPNSLEPENDTRGNLTTDWKQIDTGPDTDLFINGDMVTFSATGDVTSLDYTINGTVRPVDLFVNTSATGAVTLKGTGSISTLALTDIDKTTILPATDTTGVNDYGIDKYTGKLVKEGEGTLVFHNAGNTFGGGIVINSGTIDFDNANQLTVTGTNIAFDGSGALRYNNTTASTLYAPIRIADAETAEFNIASTGTLTASGVISGSIISNSGTLWKTGAGTLVLSAGNTFSGGAILSAGNLRLGNSNALNAYTTSGNTKGLLTVDGSGTLSTNTTNLTIRNHIHITPTGTLTLAPTGTLTIQYVDVGTGTGGAIRADDGSQIAFDSSTASLAFRDNKAAIGGAMSVDTGALTMTGRNFTFTSNTASASASDAFGGAIHVGDGDLTLTGSSITFTNNAAVGVSGNDASGGAIYSHSGTVTITAGTIAITGNRAIGDSAFGGAITAGKIIITNTGAAAALITSNRASAVGTVDSWGGAFATGTLELNATAGDIIFADNFAQKGEAVYFGVANGLLAIDGPRNVIFDDTIYTESTGNRLTKDGSGVLMFSSTGVIGDGSVVGAVNNSVFTGTVQINAGAFRVTQNTTFGYNADDTRFTLSSPAQLTGGGTIATREATLSGTISADTLRGLLIESATHTIDIGTLTFDTGTLTLDKATIRVDLSNTTGDPDAVGDADLLVVTGTLLASSSGTFDLYDYDFGQYKLVQTGDSLAASILEQRQFTATAHGKNLTDRHNIELVLGNDSKLTAVAAATTDDKDLWLIASANNLSMYWLGNLATTATWNPYDTNSPSNELWANHKLDGSKPTTEGHVINADVVRFHDIPYGYTTPVTSNTVAVTDSHGGVIVSAMYVYNDNLDYTFTGGSIATSSTWAGTILNNYFFEKESLVKTGSGALIFRNAGNTFDGGIRLGYEGGTGSAGTLAFNSAAQLGDGGKGIHFRQDAVLRADATATAANNLRIYGNKTATISTPAATTNLILTGTIDTDQAGGSPRILEKTGLGTLTLAGVGTLGNDGAMIVNAGTLALTGTLHDANGYIGGTAGSNAFVTVGTNALWNNAGGNLYVGESGTGALTINDGTVISNTGYIGANAGSRGTVTVNSGGLWQNGMHLYVGGTATGTGALLINGGTVKTYTAYVAYQQGSSGSVAVTGSGLWEIRDMLYLGGDYDISTGGMGALTISDSSTVKTRNAFVGSGENGVGIITVNTGGLLEITDGYLRVGQRGTGALLITGGTVSTYHSVIGSEAGSSGTITVRSGGLLQMSGNMSVGYSGNGVLDVLAGGTVSMQGRYSHPNTGTGTLNYTLSGTGQPARIIADQFSFGNSSNNNTLNVRNYEHTFSAATTATDLRLTREMIIHGTNAIYDHNTNFNSVNLFAPSSDIRISSTNDYLYLGGIVDGNDYYVGYELAWKADWYVSATNRHGTFTVNDTDSFNVNVTLSDTWQNSAKGWDGKSLTKLGDGTLILSGSNTYSGTTTVNGGTLSITGYTGGTAAIVGGTAGSTGVLTLAGGTLVTNENTGTSHIGYEAGASGTVIVNAGGLWQSQRLIVGSSGSGALAIASGTVEVAYNLTIGGSAASRGTVTIDADGVLKTSGNSFVGGSGTGVLNLVNGGKLESDADVVVANGANSTGIVNIGLGGASGILAVGSLGAGSGTATLKFDHTDDATFDTILSGSLKLVKDSTTAGSSGTTTLTGSSSYNGGTWINDGALQITGSAATAGKVGSIVNIAATGTFIVGQQDGATHALGNHYTGTGVLVANSGSVFAFGADVATSGSNGAEFTGQARMQNVRYTIDGITTSFLAGGASLVTKPGSFGTVASNTAAPGRAWDMRKSALVLNGGTLAWTIDSANKSTAVIAAGSIASDSATAGNGTTTFQVALSNDVDAIFVRPAYGNDASLFAMQRNGNAILLATSTSNIETAVAMQDIDVALTVGDVAQSGSTFTQAVVQSSGATADATIEIKTLSNTGTDLSIGYRLTKLAVYENAELQVILKHDDTVPVFDTEITDKTTNGSVLFASGTGAASEITLMSRNTYTGTTTVGENTTLILGRDNALGNSGTHTSRLVATASNALVTLGTTSQIVGSVDIDNTGGEHTGVLDLGTSGTLAIADAGGAIRGNNALTGTGALHLDNGTLRITGSNADLAAAVDIAAGATATLNETTGLGAATPGVVTLQGTGSIFAPAADNGTLRLDGAQGFFAKNLAGGGNVEIMNAANVTLVGSNTAFAGSYHIGNIATSGTLTLTTADTLGDTRAILIQNGRLIADTAADWTLGSGDGDGTLTTIADDARGILAGVGVFEKTNTGTVTLARQNTAFSGDIEINGGALRLTHVLATGVQAAGKLIAIADHAALELDLAQSGAYLREITSTGTDATIAITGENVTIGANNSTFSGTWNIATSADYADTTATDSKTRLGDGAIVNLTGSLALTAATGTYTFANALDGCGLLTATLAGAADAFRFDTAAATSRAARFTGTLDLRRGEFLLDAADAAINPATGKGAGALADATLKLGLDASTLLSGTYALGHLALDGGTLKVATTGSQSTEIAGFLTVTDLTGTGTLAVDIPTGISPIPPSASAANVFEDDFDPRNSVQVVRAMGTVSNLTVDLDLFLTRFDGSILSDPTLITYAAPDASASAATGYYDYFAATVFNKARGLESENGLYVAYGLYRINADEAGELFVLDNTGASDNALTAQLTSKAVPNPTNADTAAEHDAGFEFRAAGTGAADRIIVGNANSSYTGRTLVSRGLVELFTDNAFGRTSQLDITGAATVDLAGMSQTVGLLNTDAGTTLDLNGGALTITGSNQYTGETTGAVAGTLTGAGALNLAAGRLDILSANTALDATVAIASEATARLARTSGLGSSLILLEGTLQIDNAASGTLANTLEGSGLFLKTNTGAVTLVVSGSDFTGSGSIAAGRVIATREDNLGAAPIGVAAPGVYEMRGIASGTLQNRLSGSGTFALTNSDLVIEHANTIANTTLANATATLRHTHALGGSSARIALDSQSTLWLDVDAAQLGALSMGGGTLGFLNPLDTADIAALDNTPGILRFNVDFSAVQTGVNDPGTVANHLHIANAGSGSHTVIVDPHGTPSVINTSIELIAIDTGAPTFTLGNPGEKIEFGPSTYELIQGDSTLYTPDPFKWYLTDAGLSHSADAIINTASTLALDWANALDALHLRMGELRQENLRTPDSSHPDSSRDSRGNGNLWLRTRGYRLNIANAVSGVSFRQYGWGVTAGADKTFATEHGVNLVGGFIDMGSVDRRFDNAGTGSTRNIGIGAYATLLRNEGWFADAIARLDRYSNEFDARANNGRVTHGKYNVKAQSLGIEAGRLIERTDGWWVEPALQAAVFWLNGATYDTQATAQQRAIAVRIGDGETWQYRARLRFGRQWKDSKWHPYGKFAAVAVDSDGGEIAAYNKTYRADYDGKRLEFGFGAMYRINDMSQAYIDYEYAKASRYERPWAMNLGYRRLW